MSHDTSFIHSNPGVRTDLMTRTTSQIKVTEFFGSVQQFVKIKRTQTYEPLMVKLPIVKVIKEHSHIPVYKVPQEATLTTNWILELINYFY